MTAKRELVRNGKVVARQCTCKCHGREPNLPMFEECPDCLCPKGEAGNFNVKKFQTRADLWGYVA